MEKLDLIQPYLDAVSSSSNRARTIIMVIVTASIVFFIPEWNELPQNWGEARLQIAKKALEYWGWNPTVRQHLVEENKTDEVELFDRSHQFVDEKVFQGTNDLAMFISNLENDKHYTVDVPVFDVKIQTNDLGIFCGFTFVVLLCMLRMSLSRGVENLRITFAQVPDKDEAFRKQVYDLLIMQQVLTVPPTAKNEFPSRLWVWLAKAFCFLPLLVQLTIVCNDIYTYRIGLIMSPVATGIALLGNVLFLGFVVMLTHVCVKLSFEYDNVFRDEFYQLTKPQK